MQELEPFYRMEEVFWDREKLTQEALTLKNTGEDPTLYDLKIAGVVKPVLPYVSIGENTPALAEMWNNFQEKYGQFNAWAHYFYIHNKQSYKKVGLHKPGWHRDNLVPDNGGSVMTCCFNIILTARDSHVEFLGYREPYSYEAGFLNISKPHRIKDTGEDRIIARVSFFETPYEEIIERIKNG